MISEQTKQQVMDKLTSLLDIANRRYGKNMTLPPVHFDCNDTRGGYFRSLKCTLHFNPTLCVQNFQHYLDTTVPHEMAHFVQSVVFPDTLRRSFNGYRTTRARPHGREWQSIMRVFGIRNPERCHSYDVSDVKRRVFKKYPVYCGCAENHTVHQVTMKIITKLQAGRTYTCRICGKRITLTKPLTSAPQPVEYAI